ATGLLSFSGLPVGEYDYSTISAPDHETLAGGQLVVAEGTGVQTEVFTLTGKPRLAVTPASTLLVVAPEETGNQEFTITNNGAAPLAGVTLDFGNLPPWTYLGAAIPPTLQPGESYNFILYATPPITAEGEVHAELITINGGGQQQQAALTLQVTFANRRDLEITATDS
ncbi:MAG: hypothetical protein GY797_09360, partial [Deltaproteobacteria bacterium]|nr:hypothetical protein [Deltaproteobacteria bacterium]